MMKSERFNAWLQIASNLGLIGGLVLVAVQIQQTRDLTLLQMRLERLGSFQQTEVGMLGDDPSVAWAKSIREPGSLSDAEVKVVDSYLINQLNHWNRLVVMEEAGLVELGALEDSVRRDAWFYFGNSFARRWWRSMRDTGEWDSEFARLLDAQIARLDQDTSEHWLNDMRSATDPDEQP